MQNVPIAQSVQSAVQGKWGWYPCSRDAYLKLKKLNAAYIEAIRQSRRWDRWNRKEPQNRILRRWLRNEKRQRIGFEIIGPAPEPQVNHKAIGLYSMDIQMNYARARYPQSIENVQPLTISAEQIDKMIADLGL